MISAITGAVVSVVVVVSSSEVVVVSSVILFLAQEKTVRLKQEIRKK